MSSAGFVGIFVPVDFEVLGSVDPGGFIDSVELEGSDSVDLEGLIGSVISVNFEEMVGTGFDVLVCSVNFVGRFVEGTVVVLVIVVG